MALQHINIDEPWGSCDGYCVTSDQEQVPNFLSEWTADAVGLAAVLRQACDRVAVLKNLNVPDEHRGQGNGAALLEDFLEQAIDGWNTAVLLLADSAETQQDGFSLQRFYEGYDFVVVCETGSGPLMAHPESIGMALRDYVTTLKATPSKSITVLAGSPEP